MKPMVICIVGPTASGKTVMSVALAKKVNGEIISADSMQIYKELNVATAKVTESETQGIPHHLIDICDITDSFSVADFKELCYDKINDILSRGKVPIIVGGTGLYVSAVVNDMQFDKQDIDEEYRNELYELAKQKSNEYVHSILEEIDEESAKQIHPNNLKRVVRAIEIAKNSNKLKSLHMIEENERINSENKKYEFKIYALNFTREKLYERINFRVDEMVKDGLIDEAKKVYDMNLPSNVTCMQAIGYKEIFPYFDGIKNLEECIDKLKNETRKYAKRQLTWFNNKLDVNWLNPDQSLNDLVDIIIKESFNVR